MRRAGTPRERPRRRRRRGCRARPATKPPARTNEPGMAVVRGMAGLGFVQRSREAVYVTAGLRVKLGRGGLAWILLAHPDMRAIRAAGSSPSPSLSRSSGFTGLPPCARAGPETDSPALRHRFHPSRGWFPRSVRPSPDRRRGIGRGDSSRHQAIGSGPRERDRSDRGGTQLRGWHRHPGRAEALPGHPPLPRPADRGRAGGRPRRSPIDDAELVEMVRAGKLVRLAPITETYVLYEIERTPRTTR